jgi:hypothetical protein
MFAPRMAGGGPDRFLRHLPLFGNPVHDLGDAMNCHRVRDLRACEKCGQLGYKQDFIKDGKNDLCPSCAWPGTVELFVGRYGLEQAGRLPLNVIGSDNMIKLLEILEVDKRAAKGETA